MRELRQSTAVTVKAGPFVDDTDGTTAETALTIAQADVRLSKNGANIAQKNDSASATHDELGFYDIDLDATDTNTLGHLRLIVKETGALVVVEDFMVVEAGFWDTKYLGSGVIYGQAQTGTLTTAAMSTDLTGYADDELIGRVVTFISGTAEGQQEAISDYASTNGLITFNAALVTAPANGDDFKIT